ncbi:MAG: STAS domain-containing protein [Sinimarinibacterium sp.]
MKLDKGALTFTQAEHGFARIDDIAADGRIDLSDVTQADSAGVALLLEIARRVQRRGARLELLNPPDQLRGLLRFFGVDGILGVDRAAARA